MRRIVALGMAGVVLCGSLTGCGSLKDLTSSSKPLIGGSPTSSSPSSSPAPTATTTAGAVVAKLPVRPSGPLDTGSVVHRLKQGNFTVQLTYWTSDNAKLY